MTPATRDDTQRALDALRDKTLEDKEDQGLLNAAIWLLELAGETRGGASAPAFLGAQMTKETEIPALMLSIAFEQFMGALRHYVACWLRVHISEAAGRYFFLFRAHARELLGAGALGLLVGFNSTFISAALVATWGK